MDTTDTMELLYWIKKDAMVSVVSIVSIVQLKRATVS